MHPSGLCINPLHRLGHSSPNHSRVPSENACNHTKCQTAATCSALSLSQARLGIITDQETKPSRGRRYTNRQETESGQVGEGSCNCKANYEKRADVRTLETASGISPRSSSYGSKPCYPSKSYLRFRSGQVASDNGRLALRPSI